MADPSGGQAPRTGTRRSGRRFLVSVLVVQGLLFVLLPLSGSTMSWGIFSPFNAEIAADLIGPGASPWDGFDGLVAGPLALAVIQAPLLALLGRVGLVHVLGMGLLSLSATGLTWLFCDRHLGRPAALAATLLVAFPPPNTWFHQHVGAHHLLGPALVPLAMLLLWPSLHGRERRRRPWLSEGLGWTLLAGVVFLTPTTVSLALSLGLGWWLFGLGRSWRAGRLVAWLHTVPPAIGGALIGVTPLLYKALLHERYGGLAPAGGASARQATKPLFLEPTGLADLPGRLLEMVAVDFPYGLHFGLHGLGAVGVVWALAAGAALGILCWALRRGWDRSWLPLLAAPPAVLVVGLSTGWFVFHPGDGEPLHGDARHLLGLTWVLSLCIGAAVGLLPLAHRRVGWLLVGLLAAGSVGTQAASVRWGALELDLRSPWRLEARQFHGFFAGPCFEGAPEAAVRACSSSREPGRSDCLRGLAMAWGYGRNLALFEGEYERLDELRRTCAALEQEASVSGLAEQCWVGLGFGLAHLQYQSPPRAMPLCASTSALTEPEVRACRVGVGFGFAQDFGYRPEVIRRWTAGLEEPEAWSIGVGVYAGMLSRDEGFVRARCRELVGPERVGDCLRGARRNDRFMAPIERRDR